jgi:hypothetical protein
MEAKYFCESVTQLAQLWPEIRSEGRAKFRVKVQDAKRTWRAQWTRRTAQSSRAFCGRSLGASLFRQASHVPTWPASVVFPAPSFLPFSGRCGSKRLLPPCATFAFHNNSGVNLWPLHCMWQRWARGSTGELAQICTKSGGFRYVVELKQCRQSSSSRCVSNLLVSAEVLKFLIFWVGSVFPGCNGIECIVMAR